MVNGSGSVISERAFEVSIEAALLWGGPDEVAAGAAEVRERREPFGYDGMQAGRLPPAPVGGLRP